MQLSCRNFIVTLLVNIEVFMNRKQTKVVLHVFQHVNSNFCDSVVFFHGFAREMRAEKSKQG